ncbi:cytochrome b [Achromobacter sp. NPDC058515]|uniref:cytochrome b n=1 Tax=Achromobacter sp. NPDC058515 TaxID=3346533 RepID=UPI00364F9145
MPACPTGATLMDRPDGYGIVSRTLHWLMAALLAWQFTSAAARQFLPDTPVEEFFWFSHTSLGFLLFILVLVRGAWALANARRRPDSGYIARLGHLILYAFMVAIPTLSLLRAYGRGRGYSPFGIEIFSRRDNEIESLVELGNTWHGLLGWTLLALAAGHVVMAFVHRKPDGQPVLSYMTKGK